MKCKYIRKPNLLENNAKRRGTKNGKYKKYF